MKDAATAADRVKERVLNKPRVARAVVHGRMNGLSLPGAADGARRRPGLLACDESARVVQQSGLIDELEHDAPKLGLRSRKVKPGERAIAPG